jgi:peptide/nickel transport system substrate-binding protein
MQTSEAVSRASTTSGPQKAPMEAGRTLSRRDFLRVSAMAAAGAVIAACGGQTPQSGTGGAAATAGAGTADGATTVAGASGAPGATAAVDVTTGPLKASGNYKEAPALAELVKAGKLPPVSERLPKNPYVVPHAWVKPGKYGGTMTQVSDASWGMSHFMQESQYGYAPLRFLKDGLEVGPGLVESWESNPAATQWTLRIREGLKWSDGKPFTTADWMYWWEDIVLNEEHPDGPPEAVRNTNGTPAKITAPDAVTLVINLESPNPILPDYLANGVGWNNWFQPKHYLSQFHNKYNNKAGKDWVKQHDQMREWVQNPACPTMTGWKLKEFKEGQQTVWERNPFYWCVDKEGSQLPFIDTVYMLGVQDPEVRKLQIQGGKANYVHGAFIPLTLGDVQGLRQTRATHKMDIRLWDSGSGTGSLIFFNYDYHEPKLRALFHDPKFRQALSYAYNREQVRKSIYYNSGELTTGTLSPKGVNFNINAEGKQIYQQWRDSFAKYDPEKAKSMLDALGVKVGAGGKRTLPDGSPLQLSLDYHADTGREHIQKNELLVRDWQAIGIETKMNPVPPDSFDTAWKAGTLMSKTDWEVGDNTPLIYPGWVVPVQTDHWAPLHAQWYILRGTPKEKAEENVDPYKRQPPRVKADPGGPIDRLWKLLDQDRVEPDAMKRARLEWEIMKIHMTDGPFLMGVVANYPQVVMVHEDMRNVPLRDELAQHGWVNTWIHPTPAVYDPEAYYWEHPEQHT